MRNVVLAAGGFIHCVIPSFPLFNMHSVNVRCLLAIDTIYSPGVVGFTGFDGA